MAFDSKSDSALSRSTYAGSASSQLQRMEANSNALRWHEKVICLLVLTLLCWIPGPLLMAIGIGSMVMKGLDIQQIIVVVAGLIDFLFGFAAAWFLFRKQK
jgi:uncharacterized membrane protein